MPPHNPVPGGIAIVSINSVNQQKPSARFGEKPLYVKSANNGWAAIIGLPQQILPGKYLITLDSQDGTQTKKSFRIHPLPASENQRTVNLPKELRILEFDSIARLTQRVDELSVQHKTSSESDSTEWDTHKKLQPNFNFKQIVESGSYLPYGWLLNNAIKNSVINHGWITYITPANEIVKAPATALVERIFLDDTSGMTVILDHGAGLKSLITYLNDTILKLGNQVKQGEIIGTASTLTTLQKGRVDWQLILNGYLIDPLQFSYSS